MRADELHQPQEQGSALGVVLDPIDPGLLPTVGGGQSGHPFIGWTSIFGALATAGTD